MLHWEKIKPQLFKNKVTGNILGSKDRYSINYKTDKFVYEIEVDDLASRKVILFRDSIKKEDGSKISEKEKDDVINEIKDGLSLFLGSYEWE